MRRVPLLATALIASAAFAGAASAASVAYIEDGNVWVSSPDGSAKVQLTTDGTLERPWYVPSQSVDGRTFAVQRMDWLNFLNMRLQTFSASNGAPGANVTLLGDASKLTPVRPNSGDVTDDGTWHMHEASYCVTVGLSFCGSLPIEGWVTPTQQDWGIMKPTNPPSVRQPTYWGNRVVGSNGTDITLGESGGAAMFGGNAASWATPSSGAFKFKRADVPASGGKIAIEVYRPSPGPGEARNMISVIPFTGATDPPTLDPANGCDMPQVGNAHSVSWSPDGSMIAWRDDRGLVVAGGPVLPSPVDNICKLSSSPVVITSRPASKSTDQKTDTYLTLTGPSFGGADVKAMLAARQVAPSAPAPTAPATVTRGPVTAPASAPLTAPIPLTIMASKKGMITAVARIPAAKARKLRLPVIVARGSVRVTKKGRVTLRLRPTAAARRASAKLKGTRMIVTVTMPGRAPVKVPIVIG